MTTNPPQHASDFESIYYPDGTCGVASSQGDCQQPGVVLGYDTFSPEIGTWFCAEHWPEFEHMITIVEDRRTKETGTMNIDYPQGWRESGLNPEQVSEFIDKRRDQSELEQAILEAAENASDDLMDLLQKAIETMDEALASRLMDKVHQVQSENLRDIREWKEEIDGTA